MTTIQKDTLDRFYTKEWVAEKCLSLLYEVVGKEDWLFLEPSAGGGSFYKNLPEGSRKGIDLDPQCDGVVRGDYLLQPKPNTGVVVVGNPPFGKRNSLTKSFIRHSLEASVIAFILPSVFKKETMQKVFPHNWSLTLSEDLPNSCFEFEGKDYHVPCVFQVWMRDKNTLPNLRESVKVKRETSDFTFTNKVDTDDKWFMFGASPSKIIPSEDVDKNNRGYYIKGSHQVLETLRNIDWKSTACSSASGGVAWWTKQQIVDIYLDNKEREHEKQPKS